MEKNKDDMVGEQFLMNRRKLMDKNKPGTRISPSKSTKRGNTGDDGTVRKSKKRKFVLLETDWGSIDGNKHVGIDCTVEEGTGPLSVEAGGTLRERDEVSSDGNVLH